MSTHGLTIDDFVSFVPEHTNTTNQRYLRYRSTTTVSAKYLQYLQVSAKSNNNY